MNFTSPDLNEIRAYWAAVRTPDEIVELRYLTTYADKKTGKIKSGSRNVRCSGPEELAAAVKSTGSDLTYWVNLQRMKQDTPPKAYGRALGDTNIECYRWLPIDYDPKRPGKVSASAPEKKNAHTGAYELYRYLKSLGVDPVIIDSGSGFYVLPPIDLPNTPENQDLVERAIAGLKAKFNRTSSEGLIAKVDGTAVNPSRVFGLPGTMNAKGESTLERPHRPRLLLCAGSRDVLLSVAQLEEMASWAPTRDRDASSVRGIADGEKGPFTFENVEALFETLRDRTAQPTDIDKQPAQFDFERGTPSGGEGWNVRCPKDAEHSNPSEDLDGSSVVWMTTRGFAIFHCSHDGNTEEPCYDLGWKDFIEGWRAGDLQKDLVDPDFPPSFIWTPEGRGPSNKPLWIFTKEADFALFKHRVEQTPAWANAAEWKDPDGWPELPADYDAWKTSQPPTENGFKFPRVPGKVCDYALLPLRSKFDGWFGRGRVSLIGGPSGAGKTSFMCDMLDRQRGRSAVLGHIGAGLRPLIIFADRGELSNAETLDRLGLTNAALPIAHLTVCWDETATRHILDLVEAQSPFPEIVLVEGADTLVSDAAKAQVVAPFLSGLQKIAAYYHIAFVLSVGAPKAKPREQHTLKRDRVFGSQIWPRMADTIATLEAVGDGTGSRRDLTVQHRNALSETFELEFQNGRLVQHIARAECDALDIWLSEHEPKSWFTRDQAVKAMADGQTGMRKSTVYERLREMIEYGALEKQWNKDKKKEELRPRTVIAEQRAAGETFAPSNSNTAIQ